MIPGVPCAFIGSDQITSGLSTVSDKAAPSAQLQTPIQNAQLGDEDWTGNGFDVPGKAPRPTASRSEAPMASRGEDLGGDFTSLSPFLNRLVVWGSVASSPSGVRDKIPAEKRISLFFQASQIHRIPFL